MGLPFKFALQDDKQADPDHPSHLLECALCRRKGNHSLSGRLLPVEQGRFIHANCALFSNEVFEIENGTLINVLQVLRQSESVHCHICGEGGASVACFAKRCQHWYHLHCAIGAEMRFLPSKRSFCKGCFRPGSKNIGVVDFEEIKSQAALIHKGDYSFDKYRWDVWATERKLVVSRHQQHCRSLSDIEECQFSLWRPYVCDHFNRIGNMTVLRLDDPVMQLWGDLPVQTPGTPETPRGPTGYLGLKVYWKLPFGSKGRGYLLVAGFRNGAQVFDYGERPPFSEEVLLDLREVKTMRNGLFKFDGQPAETFFNGLVETYAGRHENFSLNNLIFGSERFLGMEAFPVKVWNNASHDYKVEFLSLPEDELKALKASGKLLLDEKGRPMSYSDTPGLA